MVDLSENISRATVVLPNTAYQQMLKLVQLSDRLWQNPAYREQVYPLLPHAARFDPGHASAMMCYDFHLVGDQARLIEINTNAGGGLLACMACDPSISTEAPTVPAKLKDQLLGMFADEMRGFTDGGKQKPSRVVIVDDDPPQQHLYLEMQAFRELFTSWGVTAEIADPVDLENDHGTLRLAGHPVDMIYNRHCDFYLASDEMAAIRKVYLAGKVCLTPNPRMYGLLADKRRLILLSDPESRKRWHLSTDEEQLLHSVVPQSSLLAEHDRSDIWQDRKSYAFKPVDSFGSRGVLLGTKISRKRFDELPLHETLVQQLVPPSTTEVPGYETMKTDFRVYAYRDKVFGVTARLYQGQVTNLRTAGGGFARVNVV